MNRRIELRALWLVGFALSLAARAYATGSDSSVARPAAPAEAHDPARLNAYGISLALARESDKAEGAFFSVLSEQRGDARAAALSRNELPLVETVRPVSPVVSASALVSLLHAAIAARLNGRTISRCNTRSLDFVRSGIIEGLIHQSSTYATNPLALPPRSLWPWDALNSTLRALGLGLWALGSS